MRKNGRSLVTGLILIALLACWMAAALGAEKADKVDVVAGNNAFAFDLYAKLSGQKGNLFFSPYSISTALAMTYAGARGDTENQMAEALHLGPNEEPVHGAFGKLVRDLNAAGKKGKFQLSVANALWAQKDYKFLDAYFGLVTKTYDAGLRNLDFAGATEAARKTINGWVEKRTQDKIKELFKPGILNPNTRLVLTNAIYFKGDWASQFDKKMTKDAPFYLGVPKGYRGITKPIKVPMMYRKSRFKYADLKTFKILEMPYKGDQLSMVVLLPKSNYAEDRVALEKSLTVKNLTAWLGKLRKREMRVFLPKFKMTSEFTLNQVLASLGMTDAFTPGKANFSGMDGTYNLFISAVVHKAFVDVNEEGTEAAAATGVAVGLTAAAPKPAPVFRADRPFLFLIRDSQTGSILFLGRVTNPKN